MRAGLRKTVYLGADSSWDVLKHDSVSVMTIVLQSHVTGYLTTKVSPEFFAVHETYEIIHFISEPLCVWSFNNQGSDVTNKVRTKNHIKWNIYHYEYHFSQIHRVYVSITWNQTTINLIVITSQMIINIELVYIPTVAIVTMAKYKAVV